jgi:hypothetical protein
MNRKLTVILSTAIAVLSLALIAGGCRARRQQAQAVEGDTAASIAPSDAGLDDRSTTPVLAPSEKASGQTETNSIVDPGGEGVDFQEREEIRRSYTLKPGAEVMVSNINGRVDIETAEIDRAEVFIVRSARKKEDLQFRRIGIEHQPDMLHIRVEQDRRSLFSAFGSIPEGRQRVVLKLPRKVQIDVNGVNGNLTAGEVGGRVEVRGVNGKVMIAQTSGSVSFRGVNGDIEATVAKLTGDGITISGVNGNTNIRFIGEVNADVSGRGMNGKVESDLPNLEVRAGERSHARYNARIGAGGAPIELRGVNGNVYLLKAQLTPATTARAKAK